MELARGNREKSHGKIEHFQNGRTDLNSVSILVIKLPNLRVLRIVSQSVFLGMVILSMLYGGTIFKGPSGSYLNALDCNLDSDQIQFGFLNSLLQDLSNEGFIERGHKVLIVSSGIEEPIDGSNFIYNEDFDLEIESDCRLEREGSFPDEAFDFVLLFGSVDKDFVDRLVKIGGIVAVQLSHELSNAFQKQSNYRIVYLRRYDYTIVALRKTGARKKVVDSSTNRRLCQFALEAKKTALKSLEDVFLEPPRTALARSDAHRRRFEFLPNLLGDSLENYPRRIFIDVDFPNENNNVMSWFHENYPTRNKEFETFNIEMVHKVESRNSAPFIDVSDWLMKNVKEEDYVVMKAEAEVVEDMIRRATICLVDELFLECNCQWQGGGRKKGKSAYWECLALYGRLRDEGVAVHQWWN